MKTTTHPKSHRPVTEINHSRIRNLQVASAGENEEDLWVVDGQQRTARRDDEHGCALNSSVLLKGQKTQKHSL